MKTTQKQIDAYCIEDADKFKKSWEYYTIFSAGFYRGASRVESLFKQILEDNPEALEMYEDLRDKLLEVEIKDGDHQLSPMDSDPVKQEEYTQRLNTFWRIMDQKRPVVDPEYLKSRLGPSLGEQLEAYWELKEEKVRNENVCKPRRKGMKDLRTEFLKSWEQAEKHGGDFQDCLLHYLSKNLDMPVVNGEPRKGYTDEGVVEMGGAYLQGTTAASTSAT